MGDFHDVSEFITKSGYGSVRGLVTAEWVLEGNGLALSILLQPVHLRAESYLLSI